MAETSDFFVSEEPEPMEAPPADQPIVMPPPDDGFEFAGGEPAPPVIVDEPSPFYAPVDDNAAVLVPPPPPTDADPFGAPVLVENDVEEEKELSPMAKWNAEWHVTLKERKDEETAAKAEVAEAANKDMEDFHAQRQIKKDTKMAKNRADEQQKLEAMEADLENDNSWQRVNKMVDFQQDSVEEGLDVTRMRDVMLSLKNDTALADARS